MSDIESIHSSTTVKYKIDEDDNEVSSTTHTFGLGESAVPNNRQSFALPIPLQKVDNRRKQKYMCKRCNFVTEKYSSISIHFKHSHPRLAKAGGLVKHYNRGFDSPQKKHIPTLYACQHCNYITLNMRGFMNHSTRKHPRKKANPIKQGSPITTSVNKKYLEALFMSREEPQKNKVKIRRLLATYHSDSAILQDPPQFLSTSCILCNQEFPSTTILGQHYEMCHSHQGPKKNHKTNLYHCKLCSHETYTRMTLYKHYTNSHFMDAFYAWNVPYLEPSLLEKDKAFQSAKEAEETAQNGTESSLIKNVVLEDLDIFLPTTIRWDVQQCTQQQISECRIPCVLCDFSTVNLVQLLSHYHDQHDGQYPKGLKSALLGSLMLHIIKVDIKSSDMTLIDSSTGAWLDKDSHNIIQYYLYKCKLCSYNCNSFQYMANHFAIEHNMVKEFISQVIQKTSLYVPEMESDYILECLECGYVSCYGSQKDMINHLKLDHFSASYDKYILVHPMNEHRLCGLCNVVGCLEFMQWHYANAHNHYNMRWSDLKVYKEGSLNCCACLFTTNNDVELAIHYENEHSKRVVTFNSFEEYYGYQCIICSAITHTLPGMVKHHHKHDTAEGGGNMSSVNKTVSHLACKHCRKVFTTSPYLWDHITQLHCPISQLLFIDDLPSNFIKYGFWDDNVVKRKSGRKTTTNTSKKAFGNIGKFGSNGELCGSGIQKENGHLYASTISDATDKLLCKFCHYETGHHPSMSRHLISNHHHDVTFRCFKCDMEFSAVLDCVRHHLCIHGLRISRPTAYNVLLNDIIVLSRNRPKFMCAWCGYKGFSWSLVLNHFNARHITDKSVFKKRLNKEQYYACRWCDYTTRNATCMRAHASAKHDRTISYHSLQNFQIVESDSTPSSDSSDDEYLPLSKIRKQKLNMSSKKAKFTLVKHCSIDMDSDFSDSEVYRTTHTRCKHQIRYPYVCRFCMRAFVCATTFLKHCDNEHDQWCSTTTASKSIACLPDPIGLARKVEYLKHPAYQGTDWLCELCNQTFETIVQLQEHVRDLHNGRTIYKCLHCPFISFDERKTLVHFNKHSDIIEPSGSSISSTSIRRNVSPNTSNLLDREQTWNIPVPDKITELLSDNSENDMPVITAAKSLTRTNDTSLLKRQARKSIRRSNIQDKTKETLPPISILDDAIDRSPTCASKDGNDDDDGFSFASESEKVRTMDATDTNTHFEHSVSHGGLLRCSKCDFYSADSERMAAHLKHTHMSAAEYSCKFCSFMSDTFTNLDEHLAEFHKIERNHQLGLQMKFSMEDSLVTPEAAVQSISEMKSRFLYTPTPCIPILHEDVSYLSKSTGDNTTGPSTSERFKCSYCGHIAESTYKLEMHMRRHEGNFQEDIGNIDAMNYKMNKIGMVYNYP